MKRDYIAKFCRLFLEDVSDEAIELFTSLVTLREYKRNEILEGANDGKKSFYIVISGIVAGFSKDVNNEKEFIRTIHFKNETFANLNYMDDDEIISHGHSKCLTDCILIEGDYDSFISLGKKHHEICFLHNMINQKLILLVLKRVDRLSLVDATKRYKMLRQRIPNIENLIPQYQIASYLNITPVQLSRIRKKIYSQ